MHSIRIGAVWVTYRFCESGMSTETNVKTRSGSGAVILRLATWIFGSCCGTRIPPPTRVSVARCAPPLTDRETQKWKDASLARSETGGIGPALRAVDSLHLGASTGFSDAARRAGK